MKRADTARNGFLRGPDPAVVVEVVMSVPVGSETSVLASFPNRSKPLLEGANRFTKTDTTMVFAFVTFERDTVDHCSQQCCQHPGVIGGTVSVVFVVCVVLSIFFRLGFGFGVELS